MDKKKILIIDDEKDFTQLVKTVLEGTNRFEVFSENEGARGIESAKENQPDLVLLDLIMPDIEGSYVAARLKQEEKTKGIPVVFLTAAITPEEETDRAGIIGGNPFIAKPISIRNLIDVIDKYSVKGK